MVADFTFNDAGNIISSWDVSISFNSIKTAWAYVRNLVLFYLFSFLFPKTHGLCGSYFGFIKKFYLTAEPFVNSSIDMYQLVSFLHVKLKYVKIGFNIL